MIAISHGRRSAKEPTSGWRALTTNVKLLLPNGIASEAVLLSQRQGLQIAYEQVLGSLHRAQVQRVVQVGERRRGSGTSNGD